MPMSHHFIVVGTTQYSEYSNTEREQQNIIKVSGLDSSSKTNSYRCSKMRTPYTWMIIKGV